MEYPGERGYTLASGQVLVVSVAISVRSMKNVAVATVLVMKSTSYT
jgi:hypothetical protein